MTQKAPIQALFPKNSDRFPNYQILASYTRAKMRVNSNIYRTYSPLSPYIPASEYQGCTMNPIHGLTPLACAPYTAKILQKPEC